MNDKKRDRDIFKLNFYSHVYNEFVEINVFPEPVKTAELPVKGSISVSERVSYLVPGNPYFQACVNCSFCDRPPGRLLFFIFIYFILCLFHFHFIFCAIRFIYLSFNPHRLMPLLVLSLKRAIHCL